MSKRELVVGGIKIEVTKKKNMRNLRIRVRPPEGKVLVSVPAGTRDQEIRRFVEQKSDWIMEARARVLEMEQRNRREYVSGEVYPLWGEPCVLQVVSGAGRSGVRLEGNQIILTVPQGCDAGTRERTLLAWYRRQLREALALTAEKCEEKTGLRAQEYRIKNMKTRWGTCNIEKRRIWISHQLAAKPAECLSYVVIHELTHLLERNHMRRFYGLLEGFCPDWRRAEELLKKS